MTSHTYKGAQTKPLLSPSRWSSIKTLEIPKQIFMVCTSTFFILIFRFLCFNFFDLMFLYISPSVPISCSFCFLCLLNGISSFDFTCFYGALHFTDISRCGHWSRWDVTNSWLFFAEICPVLREQSRQAGTNTATSVLVRKKITRCQDRSLFALFKIVGEVANNRLPVIIRIYFNFTNWHHLILLVSIHCWEEDCGY